MTTLKQLIDLDRPFHTEHQIGCYILGRGGVTPFGVLRQAVRELRGRWEALKMGAILVMELELKEQKLLARDQTDKSTVFKLIKVRMRLETQKMLLMDTARELASIYSRAVKLREQLPEVLDHATYEKLDKVEQLEDLRRRCAIEMWSQRHVSQGNYELIMSLPHEERTEMLTYVQRVDDMKTWVKKLEYVVPPPCDNPTAQIHELMSLAREEVQAQLEAHVAAVP